MNKNHISVHLSLSIKPFNLDANQFDDQDIIHLLIIPYLERIFRPMHQHLPKCNEKML